MPFLSLSLGTIWNIMEQNGTVWNTMEQFETLQEGEQMTDQEQITGTDLKEQEQTALTPDAIYKNNIYALVDDVKQEPLYQGLTDRELKQDKSFFSALVQYIYNNYIGKLLDNKDRTTKTVYPDIDILNDLFNIYIDLVIKYKWNNRPTILEFSILTGVSRDSYYKWLKGDFDNNIAVGDKRKHITSKYTNTVQKWNTICESALVDGSGDTIKELFLLKSKYGYREQDDRQITINLNTKPLVSADELPKLTELTSKI